MNDLKQYLENRAEREAQQRKSQEQKPWVSLSDEQKADCRNFDSRWDVVEATEAKLRELNEVKS